MRLALILLSTLLLCPALASAQELSDSERSAAMERVRALSECLSRNHEAMERLMRLVGESERQRETARDPAARRDADRAIEALLARFAEVQRRARACTAGAAIPEPGTTHVVRPPPPDSAADVVAGTGGTVRTVEENARLSTHIHIVRGEQVDGHGQLDSSVVRGAVRSITARLDRCYEQYLDRGTFQAHHLDLVFTFRGSARARSVSIERSDFGDATFERCVRSAGQRLRVSNAPSGGEASFSYRLRFGRAP